MSRSLVRRGALLACASVLAACGGTSGDPSGSSPAAGTGGAITVAAASSLTEALTEIGAAFEASHPGTEVRFDFDSSAALAARIADGAPADAFVSADEQPVADLADAGRTVGEPVVIARNRLAIVAQPGNPEGITGLADLADLAIVSLCAATAPCGTLSAAVLERAGVSIAEDHVTRGQNAKATLTAVSEGDADAGIVYVTDARAAADRVDVVELPDAADAVAAYPAVALSRSRVTAAFVAYLVGADAQAVLAGAGFLPPA